MRSYHSPSAVPTLTEAHPCVHTAAWFSMEEKASWAVPGMKTEYQEYSYLNNC